MPSFSSARSELGAMFEPGGRVSQGKFANQRPTKMASINSLSDFFSFNIYFSYEDTERLPLKSEFCVKLYRRTTNSFTEVFIMKGTIKKLTALLLSCLLLLSITACGKKRSAKEVMQSSLKQSAKLKDSSFSGDVSYSIATEKQGSQSNVTVKMNFDTKLQSVDKDQLKMSMTSTLNMMGQSIDMNMYYSDGYYYMNTSGTKQKMKMDIAGLKKQLQSTTGQTSLPIKYYKDLKLSEKDGNTMIKYSINSAGLNKYIQDLTSQMTTVTGGSNSVKITSMSGTKTLNDKDIPVEESIKMVMESGENEVGTITLKMNLTYHNPGKSVTVDFPQDLNTYKEISAN